jgi:hypothetical protein
LITF